jgi:dihydrofolate reductase
MDVMLAGGAHVCRQFLSAGLVDEIDLHLVPILLGAGERLFESTGGDMHGLTLVETVPAPGVIHLRFRRKE